MASYTKLRLFFGVVIFACRGMFIAEEGEKGIISVGDPAKKGETGLISKSGSPG